MLWSRGDFSDESLAQLLGHLGAPSPLRGKPLPAGTTGLSIQVNSSDQRAVQTLWARIADRDQNYQMVELGKLEALIKDKGDKWIEPGNYISSGPFLLKEWQHKDHITLAPNPNYAGPKPKLNKIIFNFLASREAQIRVVSAISATASRIGGIDISPSIMRMMMASSVRT